MIQTIDSTHPIKTPFSKKHKKLSFSLSLSALLISQSFMSGSAFAAPHQEAVNAAQIEEAYDYVYPSYALSTFRWNALNEKGGRTSTTLNAFTHQRAMTSPEDTWAASPLVDCLYSTAWLDLSAGPVTIETQRPLFCADAGRLLQRNLQIHRRQNHGHAGAEVHGGRP